jgi:hypothetical protein
LNQVTASNNALKDATVCQGNLSMKMYKCVYQTTNAAVISMDYPTQSVQQELLIAIHVLAMEENGNVQLTTVPLSKSVQTAKFGATAQIASQHVTMSTFSAQLLVAIYLVVPVLMARS